MIELDEVSNCYVIKDNSNIFRVSPLITPKRNFSIVSKTVPIGTFPVYVRLDNVEHINMFPKKLHQVDHCDYPEVFH